MRQTGNQHNSPKAAQRQRLEMARDCIKRAAGYRGEAFPGWIGSHRAAIKSARFWLRMWQNEMHLIPASTRRRWKCGR